jgi:hypothetical protein
MSCSSRKQSRNVAVTGDFRLALLQWGKSGIGRLALAGDWGSPGAIRETSPGTRRDSIEAASLGSVLGSAGLSSAQRICQRVGGLAGHALLLKLEYEFPFLVFRVVRVAFDRRARESAGDSREAGAHGLIACGAGCGRGRRLARSGQQLVDQTEGLIRCRSWGGANRTGLRLRIRKLLVGRLLVGKRRESSGDYRQAGIGRIAWSDGIGIDAWRDTASRPRERRLIGVA